jgi:Zn-dependent protease
VFQLMSIAGIPVTISVSYFIPIGLYALSSYQVSPWLPVVYVLVLTLSLLVHEFGHALVAKRFRLNPRITLWALGGLTFHEPTGESRDESLIVAAGPAAGLLFGGLIYVVGYFITSSSPLFFYKNPMIGAAYELSLYINIWWSLLNLLPAWPLDGGQLLRVALARWVRPIGKALRAVHWVGAAVAIAGLAYAWSVHMQFTGFLAAMLAWQNIERLMSGGSAGPVPVHNDLAADLLARGGEALGRGDAREAARLGHQVKAMTNLSRSQTAEMWLLLGLATTELGEYDEALAYLQRAPASEAVEAARARCVTGLR